jgi:putative lipoprotein
MPSINRALIAVASLLTLTGCGPAPEGTSDNPVQASAAEPLPVSTITGSVSYRERMALTPTAKLNLQLQDVSLADASAEIIAERTISNPGQVPISFALEYNPSRIDKRHSYSMRAVIRDDDKMLFTTDTHYPVLTRGSGELAVMTLVRVAPRAQAEPGVMLTGTNWQLVAIRDQAVTANINGKDAYLRLTAENEAVQGFSGCNQFNGRWSLEDEHIVLGALAMTMMACPDVMNTEQAFMQALEEQNRHEIVGNELRMYKDNELILLFRATN